MQTLKMKMVWLGTNRDNHWRELLIVKFKH